jgi:hypothetical protein
LHPRFFYIGLAEDGETEGGGFAGAGLGKGDEVAVVLQQPGDRGSLDRGGAYIIELSGRPEKWLGKGEIGEV